MLLKSDFIRRLRAKGYTKDAATVIVSDVFDEITRILCEGESVRITGFGDFVPKMKKERWVHKTEDNPQGIYVPAHLVPKFSPSLTLKARMAGKKELKHGSDEE